MKISMTCLAIALTWPGFVQCADGNSPGSLQEQVITISANLSSGQVGRVEILQIPARVMTRARITPGMLERQYHNKLTIRNLDTAAYKSEMINSFKSISARSRNEIPDIRWGVIFYSRDDTRIGTVYFDKSGEAGAVNGEAATFTGNFFGWLNATFSGCLQ